MFKCSNLFRGRRNTTFKLFYGYLWCGTRTPVRHFKSSVDSEYNQQAKWKDLSFAGNICYSTQTLPMHTDVAWGFDRLSETEGEERDLSLEWKWRKKITFQCASRPTLEDRRRWVCVQSMDTWSVKRAKLRPSIEQQWLEQFNSCCQLMQMQSPVLLLFTVIIRLCSWSVKCFVVFQQKKLSQRDTLAWKIRKRKKSERCIDFGVFPFVSKRLFRSHVWSKKKKTHFVSRNNCFGEALASKSWELDSPQRRTKFCFVARNGHETTHHPEQLRDAKEKTWRWKFFTETPDWRERRGSWAASRTGGKCGVASFSTTWLCTPAAAKEQAVFHSQEILSVLWKPPFLKQFFVLR